MASGSTSTSKQTFEVEQKFIISDPTVIENQLKELGMRLSKKKVMVDWYFDTEPPTLSLRDVWLRYRSQEGENQRQWELKKGGSDVNMAGNGTTVYQEIEGNDAVHECLKILSSFTNEKPDATAASSSSAAAAATGFDGYSIPIFPDCEGKLYYLQQQLVPFSRIETQRSSWVNDDDDDDESSSSLTVDLDVSNFGYAVGEVEYVVAQKEDIPQAQQTIANFLKRLPLPKFDDDASQQQQKRPLSKLEHYLLQYRPDHFQLLHPGRDISKLLKDR